MKKNVWIIKVQRCGQHLGYCEYNCCANGEDVGGGSGSAISNLITPIIRAWRASLGTNTNRVIFQLILYVYLDWHYTNVISFTRIYNSNSVSMGPNTSTHQLLPSSFFPSSYIFWNKVKKIIWKFHNFASIDRIYIANNIFFLVQCILEDKTWILDTFVSVLWDLMTISWWISTYRWGEWNRCNRNAIYHLPHTKFRLSWNCLL